MLNLGSYIGLNFWKTEDDIVEENVDLVSEYFQCISECDVDKDARRACKHILTE